jgi:hypothetical protein
VAKKGGGGDPVTSEVAAKVKIAKGNYDMDTKKYSAGDDIKGALKADEFKDVSADKGVTVRITTADDGPDKGKITQILITAKKNKKGGN